MNFSFYAAISVAFRIDDIVPYLEHDETVKLIAPAHDLRIAGVLQHPIRLHQYWVPTRQLPAPKSLGTPRKAGLLVQFSDLQRQDLVSNPTQKQTHNQQATLTKSLELFAPALLPFWLLTSIATVRRPRSRPGERVRAGSRQDTRMAG